MVHVYSRFHSDLFDPAPYSTYAMFTCLYDHSHTPPCISFLLIFSIVNMMNTCNVL